MAGLARGWAGRSLPLTPNATHFTSNTRSGRCRAVLIHALGESERCVLSNCFPLVERALHGVHQRIEQDPGHSAVPSGEDRPFVEAANSCSTRTVRRRDGWRPIQTTSGPLSLNG